MPDAFQELLNGNKIWVKNVKKNSPNLFHDMSEGQHPQFLWIGCADSRVPAEEITNSLPGSIFVQRNIANMVVHIDYNLLSVVNFAVKSLKVKHIIICGHYGCGGIRAAMSSVSYGLLDNWLAHIKDVYQKYSSILNAIEDSRKREEKFVELNVQEQVNNVARLSFIQEEWRENQFPYIHGWVYNMETGMLKNLEFTVNSADHLDEMYRIK